MPKTKILFVCTNNTCRSAMAEAAFRKLAREANLTRQLVIDSAGLQDTCSGQEIDPRAKKTAEARNYDTSRVRARKITWEDFDDYDFLLAMDWDSLKALRKLAPPNMGHKVMLIMRFASDHESAVVSDPYYGSQQDFDTALDCIEDACTGLLEMTRKRVLQFSMA